MQYPSYVCYPCTSRSTAVKHPRGEVCPQTRPALLELVLDTDSGWIVRDENRAAVQVLTGKDKVLAWLEENGYRMASAGIAPYGLNGSKWTSTGAGF